MILPKNGSFALLRRKMVDQQLVPRNICQQSVLQAFLTVPREEFVPPNERSSAYADCPLPTIEGQTISQPYIVALMTELLTLPDNVECKILEVGTGSGYQAAILAEMGHRIYTIERLPALAEFAKKNLGAAGYLDRVTQATGDGCLGLPEYAPYDAILVTAAAPTVPEQLVKQLKPAAKLVIPCGECYVQQMLQLTFNEQGEMTVHKSIGCRFVPLIGKDGFRQE